MIGFWLFTTIVLIDLYGSTLASYLTLTKLKSIPNSLEELAENYNNRKCLITLQKGHIALEMFKANNMKKVIIYIQIQLVYKSCF